MIRSMSDVTTLPTHGEAFLDARGGDRTLRVNWHRKASPDGMVVLSLWRDGTCVASFRMPGRDVPLLIDVLSAGVDLFPTAPRQVERPWDSPPERTWQVTPERARHVPAQAGAFDPPNADGNGRRSA
jgi:hypothetical protein